MDKSAVRKEIRRRKQAYTAEELRQLSAPIICRLLAHPAVCQAQTIYLYHSLPDEVYTHEAIRLLQEAGKQVLLPTVTGDSMEFLPYTGELTQGAFGIMEAAPSRGTRCEVRDTRIPLPMEKRTYPAPRTSYLVPRKMAVIPGVAFDRAGHRLGRGRGYYDRYFAATSAPLREITLLGLCFPFQLLDTIPYEAHDLQVDEVLT